MIIQHQIHAALTPEPSEQRLPLGFAQSRIELQQGLPAPVTVDGIGFNLLLSVPTGRGRYWLDQDKSALIATGTTQQLHVDENADETSPARKNLAPVLIFTESRVVRAVSPLIVNNRLIIPSTAASSKTSIEFMILGFSLFAAAMTGPEAGSSWINLAWRRIEKGSDTFSAPVARKSVRRRLKATTGTGSERTQRKIDTEFHSEAAPERSEPLSNGGVDWGLTHD